MSIIVRIVYNNNKKWKTKMQLKVSYMGIHLRIGMESLCQYAHQFWIEVKIIIYSINQYNLRLFERNTTF